MLGTTGFQSTATDTVFGISSAYLVRKILVGETQHPLPKLLGNTLEFVVSTIVFNHADKIKTVGNLFLKNLLKSPNNKKSKS